MQPSPHGNSNPGAVYNARAGLNAIFKPKSVAVIGATERPHSVGRTILYNLISSPFGGTVFPVNPGRDSVLGVKAYPSLSACPDPVDMAVIVTPATTVPALVQEAVDLGVRGAIIISAGFKERGPEGVALEQQILAMARGRMRIVGPNCLGVMNPINGLNATFAGAMAMPGNVGFISQSGAFCTSVLDYSFEQNIGFSAFVSIGSMLDVGWGDLIYYLGDDPNTNSIVIYMESVGDAQAFLSAAREVALTKPIIVIKAGRTEAAAQAAASHTGSLTGSDDVLDAAFQRAGVLRVTDIADVFYTSQVLAQQPRPRGKRLTIVTNAGGPGVLATDALISEGGELTDLSEATHAAYNAILPAHWSHGNPVDILGDAGPELYAKSLEIAAADPNSDGLLVILTPQAMSDPTRTAELLVPYAHIEGKPVLASWMGGVNVTEGAEILAKAGLPNFPFPDTATRMFNYLWQYNENLRGLYETPEFPDDADGPDRATASAILERVRASGRMILTETESKEVLAAYDIPIVPNKIAETADEAVALADGIGYPVVVKLNSETITHKTDVGGVQLNLGDAEAVRAAFERIRSNVEAKARAEDFQGVAVQPMLNLSEGYELILGSSLDAQFGPVLLFGTGGPLVEVFRDSALALPPLTTTLARRTMERTKIYEALHGVRGRGAVDIAELEKIMVRFGQLAAEYPMIKEMDINPLFASEHRLIALDGRIVLHEPDVDLDTVPRPAIRPYPSQYVDTWTTRDGVTLSIRPIRPEDERLAVAFHRGLSERTVKMRYMYPLALDERISHERLARLCFIDYNREMALVAIHTDAASGEPRMVAVGRLNKLAGTDEVAEFGVLVADDFQRQGLGTELIRRLIEVGRREGVRHMYGKLLLANENMRRVAERLGFDVRQEGDDTLIMERDI